MVNHIGQVTNVSTLCESHSENPHPILELLLQYQYFAENQCYHSPRGKFHYVALHSIGMVCMLQYVVLIELWKVKNSIYKILMLFIIVCSL
jgi:hypothetical protein